MDDIVAAQCHRQRRPVQRQGDPGHAGTFGFLAHAPGLVELARPVVAGVRRMGEPGDPAHPGVLGNPVRSHQQAAGTQFKAKPVGQGARQRRLDPIRKVVGNGKRRAPKGFTEGTRQRGLEFALGDRVFKGGAVNADPGTAAGRARQNVGDAHTIDALANEVDDVLQTLRKLIDLASVWGSSSLLANDRIELWSLLKEVWTEVEPMAVQRGLKVRFRASGTSDKQTALYGSHEWLKRVFVECMEAAVRAGRGGATLEIEHRQMGPRALVVFRDCGAFAPPPTQDAVAMPAAPRGKAAPAPRMAARDQIGLKLCRHIVSLHGGQLREEEEGGLRNFLIDLPTGAPHRNDHSQLDVAQAQQYARDLAALMSRARTRNAAAGTPN